MRSDPVFGFQVPIALKGVENAILNPRETWTDKSAYDAQARALVDMFGKNFARIRNARGCRGEGGRSDAEASGRVDRGRALHWLSLLGK